MSEAVHTGATRPGAIQTADEVRSGRRSAVEVVGAHLDRIERFDRWLHCFLSVDRSGALDRAEQVDRVVADGGDPGPLAGVPVALKDNLCTRGTATTCASRMLDGWVPPYDATVVEILRRAGAVVVGKTNLDEFAMGSSTEHSAFGPTRNPHDPTRVPGGSSGGSAAAVASGMSMLALGSDTGGSIRQPAALCGVVGLKPTYGMVSRYGLVAFASSLDQIGPFATSVTDAALLLDVIAGHDPRDSTSIPSPHEPIVPTLRRGVQGVRVGVVDELVDGASPEVVAAVSAAADSLGRAGASVERTSIPACRLSLSAYYLLAPAEASSNLARYDGVRYGLRVPGPDVEAMNVATRTAGFGDEVKRRIMLGTFALSSGYYDAYYGQAQKVRTVVLEAFADAYERFDLLLGATAPTTAFPLGDRTGDPMSMYLSDVFTIPSNLAGHPAVSVPWASGTDGLPLAVQLLAPALGERSMLQAASVVEASAPGVAVPSLERLPAGGGPAPQGAPA